MTENERKVFDIHLHKEEMLKIEFDITGLLLQEEIVRNIVKQNKWKQICIYGGGQLGIEAYFSFKRFVDVVGIADRSGGLIIPCKNINVFTPEKLSDIYTDLPVIITPQKYLKEIYNDLENKIDKGRIYLINELF